MSTHARVRRIAGGSGTKVKNGVPHVLATHPNSKGYWIANLWKDGERTTVKVHKIVAKAFHGEPPKDIAGEFEVHHLPQKDGVPDENGTPDKNDNRAWMIAYASAYDNMMEMQDRYYKTGKGY